MTILPVTCGILGLTVIYLVYRSCVDASKIGYYEATIENRKEWFTPARYGQYLNIKHLKNPFKNLEKK